MCTLMSTAEMPVKSTSKNTQFISWYPKPNNVGETAIVRLLWFLQESKSERKVPYFTQMVHEHWGEHSKSDGSVMNVVDDTITCPLTKAYVKNGNMLKETNIGYDEQTWVKNKSGNNEPNCPICKKEREAMVAWKMSGWKDKVAMKRHFALQAKFRAFIPVYIVKDPNNPKNDNKMKVMILTNKEDFELFDSIVKAEKAKAYAASLNGNGYEIYNGKNAIDLYLHCETVEETKKNGFVQKVRKMTGIAFDDPSNKYDIPGINKDAIDSFDMDEQFFVSRITKAELEDFYRRNYGKDEIVVPKENVNIFAKMKENQGIKAKETVSVQNHDQVVKDDSPKVEELSKDIEEIEIPEPVESEDEEEDEVQSDSGDVDINDFIDEINNIP